MMLADPRLVKAEPIEPLDQLEIALEALGRVFLIGVERRQEDPVPQVDLAHRAPRICSRRDSSETGRRRKHSPAAWRPRFRNCGIRPIFMLKPRHRSRM